MTLHYTFDDIPCDRELCDVDYDFVVTPCFEDFFEFFKPYDFKKWQKEGQEAYKKACEDLWNSNWFSIEALEDDDDFIDFMKEEYKDEAREECIDYYK